VGDLQRIWTMTVSDLLQRVRDRSVLVFGLVVPFALMLVFNVLFSGFDSAEDFAPTTVAVAAQSGDPIAGGLTDALGGLDDLMEVTIVEADAEAARAAVTNGDADVAVLVPDGFATSVTTGGSPEVEAVTSGGGRIEDEVVLAVVDSYVGQIAAASQTAAAGAVAGLPADELAAIAGEVGQQSSDLTISEGTAAAEQLSLQGSLVAGQAGLFMLFTVSFGVIGYLYEREAGTLPRLQSMPMHPRSIIIAKTLVSFVLGVVATTVLLVAGGWLFDLDFGDLVPVSVLVVTTVAAATSLVVLVAKVARTAEQAQVLQTILALVLGVLGGAFFSIGGDGLLATLSDLTPPGSFIQGLGITHAGGGVGDLAAPLTNLVGFIVLTVILAVVLPDREMAA
jgi:ABC-2 type transport system permease protein